MSHWIAIALVVAATGCESVGGGSTGGGSQVAESGTRQGSAGGFSSMMSAELAKAGVGEPVIAPSPPEPAGGAGAASGSGAAASASTAAAAGAGAAAAANAGTAAGSGAGAAAAANAGTAAGSGAGAGAGSAAGTGAGSAAGADVGTGAGSAAGADVGTAAGSATGTPAAAGTSTPGPSSPAATGTAKASGALPVAANRTHVKPSADVAAIKLELEPNWERDMGEAGTFSLVVKVPNTGDTRVFSVAYGYEDPAAPIDCDQYRKFLEDRGMMKVTQNRQRGAACYVEGTDQGGTMAYRMLLTYGGKRLVCHGSLYKDAMSAALGDLRDKVLMQAKKICETLAL